MSAPNDITSAIKKLHSISFNPLMKEVNSSEYISLKIISRLLKSNGDKGVKVSQITNELKIASPSVTKLLNGLENKELIVREMDKSNRRNTLVSITEKGVRVKEENDKILADFIPKVYDRVGRENIIQFLQLSELIHNAFDEEIENYNK